MTVQANIRRSDPAAPTQRWRALVASGVGTTIEFFDYASYSYVATTLALVFFPAGDRAAALIQTFAVFALSFVMRPVGGLFWGYFGDRIGRKATMVLTIFGMGIATVALGLLPGYAIIGMWAPVLLVVARLLQSFCAAGQYAGAALVAGEFAPPLKRGRFVSVVPMGSAAGFMLASALASLLHASLGPDEMLAWGWRVPFLIGGILTLIGWFVREALEETPDFENVRNEHAVADAPIASLFRHHWRSIVWLVCIVSVGHSGYYLVLAYMATYMEVERGFSALQASAITTTALIAYLPLLYLFAAASDRFGRRALLFAGSGLFVIGSYPAFLLLEGAGFYQALIIQLCLVGTLALHDSTVATFFMESFPPKIRFSGFALPYNISAAIFGGAAPLAAEWLIRTTGNGLMPAFIMMGIAALSLPALWASRETAPARLGAS